MNGSCRGMIGRCNTAGIVVGRVAGDSGGGNEGLVRTADAKATNAPKTAANHLAMLVPRMPVQFTLHNVYRRAFVNRVRSTRIHVAPAAANPALRIGRAFAFPFPVSGRKNKSTENAAAATAARNRKAVW